MLVGVIHRINDPDGFRRATAGPAPNGFPHGVALRVSSLSPDGTTGLCIWDGPSIDAVRDLVDAATARYAENEFVELAAVRGLQAGA